MHKESENFLRSATSPLEKNENGKAHTECKGSFLFPPTALIKFSPDAILWQSTMNSASKAEHSFSTVCKCCLCAELC